MGGEARDGHFCPLLLEIRLSWFQRAFGAQCVRGNLPRCTISSMNCGSLAMMDGHQADLQSSSPGFFLLQNPLLSAACVGRACPVPAHRIRIIMAERHGRDAQSSRH